MQDSVFTKIIKRELPAYIAYEDNDSIAFLDIHPVAMGHLLLVTKEPYKWMQDAPDTVVGHMFVKAKFLMKAMIAGLGCDFVQVMVFGVDVPHFHIQLIPRRLGEKLGNDKEKMYKAGDAEIYLQHIKDGIKKASH